MSRHPILPLAALALASALVASPARARTDYVGPTMILLVEGDSVSVVRSAEWLSAYTRHQEKLLLTSVRMRFWRDHLPDDMRRVFDELGYPTGRLLLTPAGHTEEHWYYGQMLPPLRFRDDVLQNEDWFDTLRGR